MPDVGPLSPTAHPMPPDQPRGTGSVGGLLREFHIPWPEADEGALREAASTWHTLAEAIRDDYGYANRAASSLTGSNTGAAIDAFERYWSKFGGPGGALLRSADACDDMSKLCNRYADDVAAVKHRIEEAAAGVAATVVVGAVGAFLTFSATEAAADVIAAGVVSSAADWIAELGVDLSTTLSLVSDSVAGAVSTATSITVNAVDSAASASALGAGMAGVAGGVASTALTAPLGSLSGAGTPSRAQLAEEIVVSGLTSGTGSLLGKLGELSAPQLSNLLANAAHSVSTTDPQTYVSLIALSKQVAGTSGKISSDVLSSAASQLIVSQHVDAENFSQDQLQSLLQDIAEHGQSEAGK